MPELLTDLEQKILDYMVEYLRNNTYQPSIREIGRRFDIKSTKTVSEYLQAIARKGWIERDPSRSRGIRILGVDLTVTGPEPSTETAATAATLTDIALAPGATSVRATVDGFAGTGSQEGDLIVLRPVDEREIDDGDILACRIAGEVGLARCRLSGTGLAVEWRGGQLPLRPAPAPNLEVLGRATGFWRSLAPANGPIPDESPMLRVVP